MKKSTYLFLISMSSLINLSLSAQPTDLFISEYVEGSSFNKALEFYNGTSSAIDLGAGQYVLQVYFNGSTSSTSVALSGTISAGAVFVAAHTSATLGITPDLSSSVVNFNGNDAVVLRKGGAAGPIVDVIGEVGFNPGTQWGSGDTSTLDRTIRRKSIICSGDVVSTNVFHVEPEWDGFPQNTFAGLGSHSVTCTPSGNGLSINPTTLSFTSATNVPSNPQSVLITGNGLSLPVDIIAPLFFELSLSSGGPFTGSLSIPANSFSPSPVTAYVRYSPISIGTTSGVATCSSSPYTLSLSLTGTAVGLTSIPQIQGTGSASSYTGQVISTQGIVTADYQGTNELGGFYIQDPIGDGNLSTSDGIFVSNTSYAVNAGDFVVLSGTVEEFFNRTQIKSVSSLSVQSTGNAVSSTTVMLPFSSLASLEQLEGMYAHFTQTLTVTEVYTLARYGEVSLSVNGRLMNPTNFIDPNDQPAIGTNSSGTSNTLAVQSQQNLNDLSRILLDDKSSVQNPPTVPYLDPSTNTLRCGSTLSNLKGIVDYAFSLYRIQPVVSPSFTYAPRPAVPSVGNHNVKVASFNVLNYFNGNGSGGGFPTSRGANTAIEFSRQRNKIIEAIKQINADVVGLMEMENDGNSSQSAIADLVNGLNTSMGAGTYTFVSDPTATNGGTGTDEIKVALIYKPLVLSTLGSSLSDDSTVHNRPPLAQTFILNSNQEKFSVIVNHFKSKGCSGATGANADLLDGQGCYNANRKSQAGALLQFINTIQSQTGDNDVVVMGDINAYEQEDPIDVLRAGGLIHILDSSYSYVFSGQSGSLDHAFVSQSLHPQVSGADKWHINADEPIAKDYNQEFNPAYMYDADAYRSSDHDPVMIGLKLETNTTGINSLKNYENNLSFTLLPNPASGSELKLQVLMDRSETALIEIKDQLGRNILSKASQLKEGHNSMTLSIESLSNGFYYVTLSTDKQICVRQLIIQN